MFAYVIIFCLSGEQFKTVVKQMSQLAQDGATELRVRSLDAIAQLLTLPVCISVIMYVCLCVS